MQKLWQWILLTLTNPNLSRGPKEHIEMNQKIVEYFRRLLTAALSKQWGMTFQGEQTDGTNAIVIDDKGF